MKSLHRSDLWCWSVFDAARNIDFNSTLLCLPTGNLAFDPLPVSAHDLAHIEALGGVAWVNVSNADHVRDAMVFKRHFGARIAAPGAERNAPEFAGVEVDHWYSAAGETLDCGVVVILMRGSKTPGEVAWLLPDGETLVTGDLLRGQRFGALNLLPDGKLSDKTAAQQSVRGLLDIDGLQHVVVGDGWSVFGRGKQAISALLVFADL